MMPNLQQKPVLKLFLNYHQKKTCKSKQKSLCKMVSLKHQANRFETINTFSHF